MDIAVIGTGYVGLVTGAGLSDFGNDVICVDVDTKKIEALNNGEIPIYEPGLDQLVKKNVTEGRLRFTTNLAEAIEAARAIFIAVGTPPKADGSADLRLRQGSRGVDRRAHERPEAHHHEVHGSDRDRANDRRDHRRERDGSQGIDRLQS